MKKSLSIWQVTFPLCGVLVFAITAFTTVYMVNGRYIVHFELNSQGLKVVTDVDKK